MTNNHEYDAIGELFRQRLENHRLPVDTSGWDEIERRLGKQKNKTVWLWRSGAMVAAAAAAIALLLIIVQPENQKTDVMIVSQETATEKPATINNNETNTIVSEQETTIIPQSDVVNVIRPTNNAVLAEQKNTENQDEIDLPDVIIENEILIAEAENNNETQTVENTPETVPPAREIIRPDVRLFDDIYTSGKESTWQLAANFSTNGNNSEIFEMGYSEGFIYQYNNTRSFQYLEKYMNNTPSLSLADNEYIKAQHLPPLSFGLTLRKIENNIGIESGLVYTYLSSNFEFKSLGSNSGSNKVNHSLHYVGIPVNILAFLWNSNSNWQIYASGGIMAEKGVRAIYNQEMRVVNKIHTTSVKASSIEGLQWSLNGALGINYRLEKGWGIYFEPRIGYSFDCDQPTSARTEWPLYYGMRLGFSYEL